jgi:hypothetical protein
MLPVVRNITLLFVVCALGLIGVARADTVNLTSDGAQGMIGPVIFSTNNLHSAGTGLINPFLVMCSGGGANAPCSGFNTSSGGPVASDFDIDLGKTDSLLLSALFATQVTGYSGSYYGFILDADEAGSAGGQTLTLDTLKIFQLATGDQTAIPADTPIFNLDGGANNAVLLDASLGQGGGEANMIMYVPTTLFDRDPEDFPFVMLYAGFTGEDNGPEEWTLLGSGEQGDTPVPEPATLLLIGTGLLAFGVYRRRSH